MIDTLGDIIHSYLEVIPDGVLCFFPSYQFMETLERRWKQTMIWYKINKLKKIFLEPKKLKDWEETQREYISTINKKCGGAILFAIFRGKISEGLNFSNQYSRGVFIIGIPFPNAKDPYIILKKKYNNFYASHPLPSATGKASANTFLMNGNSWYTQHAFRALNQAIGRCIRHRNDFGAVILIGLFLFSLFP